MPPALFFFVLVLSDVKQCLGRTLQVQAARGYTIVLFERSAPQRALRARVRTEEVDTMGTISRDTRPLNGLFALGLIAAAAAVPFAGGVTPAAAAAVAPSFDLQVADFYRARGGAPLWLAPTSGQQRNSCRCLRLPRRIT